MPQNWWKRECGGRDVLTLALPLIISTSFTALMHFIDRLFLTWWDVDQMTASMHAGLVQWTMICFAFGVAQYVNTFVAQYSGAGHDERVGPSVWQGIWFGVATIPIFLLAIPLAPWFFAAVDHADKIRDAEIVYFQILCVGAGMTIVSAAMSTFFTGRGQTWVAMCVSGIAALVNIVFDALLIFDVFKIGVGGIVGAAWATVLAHLATVIAYGIWMYLPRYRERFGLTRSWMPDPALMWRLIYYGGSSGAQMLIEGAGFTLLLLLIGRIGAIDSAATTLAFNVNIVAFIPMVGLGIAVSTLVGQKLGENQPHLAARATGAG
jgi:MATE family multidrug resistance protein